MNEVRKFVLEVHRDKNGFWAEVADLPGCFASGRDVPELFEALGEAIGLYLTDETRTVTVEPVSVELPEKVQKVPLDDATGHVCRLHPTARLAAETADPDGGDGRGLCPDRLPSTP